MDEVKEKKKRKRKKQKYAATPGGMLKIATDRIRRYEEKERPCMTCRAPFTSTGPHHRMCDDCRYMHSRNGGMDE